MFILKRFLLDLRVIVVILIGFSLLSSPANGESQLSTAYCISSLIVPTLARSIQPPGCAIRPAKTPVATIFAQLRLPEPVPRNNVDVFLIALYFIRRAQRHLRHSV